MRYRPPLIVRAITGLVGLAVFAAIGFVKWEIRVRLGLRPDEPQRAMHRTAPPINEGYRMFSRREGGTLQVGLLRHTDGRVQWIAQSDGTDECTPAGKSTLWNFVDDETDIARDGSFSDRGRYTNRDHAGDGEEYDKRVVYRITGRFKGSDMAIGKFWRRDTFMENGVAAFTCERSGRFTAYEL